MVADDLEYGWYKWQDGFRQKDGFFVDRTGRVIFWPDAKGPGYVLNEATAEKIGRRKKREFEEKEMVKAGSTYSAKGTVLYGSGRAGFGAMPIFIVTLFSALIEFAAKRGVASSDGDSVSSEGGAVPNEGADDPAEIEEIDLSRYPQVAGPRPMARDDLIVAKANPDLSFWAFRIWNLALAAGALWLFGLLMLHWSWNSAGDKFWGGASSVWCSCSLRSARPALPMTRSACAIRL